MAETNTSNIGFEKQIWDAACVLRGNLDASEYKSVVLGLIFLKYISDRFEAKYQELVDEGGGFEEDKDEYTAENIFFVPENATQNFHIGHNVHIIGVAENFPQTRKGKDNNQSHRDSIAYFLIECNFGHFAKDNRYLPQAIRGESRPGEE